MKTHLELSSGLLSLSTSCCSRAFVFFIGDNQAIGRPENDLSHQETSEQLEQGVFSFETLLKVVVALLARVFSQSRHNLLHP